MMILYIIVVPLIIHSANKKGKHFKASNFFFIIDDGNFFTFTVYVKSSKSIKYLEFFYTLEN